MKLDLRTLAERSVFEPLSFDEVQSISTSSKCALIRKIIKRREESQNPVLGDPSVASLLTLNRAFNISSGFYEWQRSRRQRLISQFMRPRNRHILTCYRNWDRLSVETRQYILRKSVNLHKDIYIDGLTEKLPYSYVFKEGAYRRTKGGLVLLFGTFSGDLNTGSSIITQYLQHGELIKNAREAFCTAHHEATHLVQHHLSMMYHKNEIPLSHPLYQEASYFHSIDRHQANIPSHITDAYNAQPNEGLAEWEGTKISNAIESLAL